MKPKIELMKEQVEEIEKAIALERKYRSEIANNKDYPNDSRYFAIGVLDGIRFMEKLLNLETREEK